MNWNRTLILRRILKYFKNSLNPSQAQPSCAHSSMRLVKTDALHPDSNAKFKIDCWASIHSNIRSKSLFGAMMWICVNCTHDVRLSMSHTPSWTGFIATNCQLQNMDSNCIIPSSLEHLLNSSICWKQNQMKVNLQFVYTLSNWKWNWMFVSL